MKGLFLGTLIAMLTMATSSILPSCLIDEHDNQTDHEKWIPVKSTSTYEKIASDYSE